MKKYSLYSQGWRGTLTAEALDYWFDILYCDTIYANSIYGNNPYGEFYVPIQHLYPDITKIKKLHRQQLIRRMIGSLTTSELRNLGIKS